MKALERLVSTQGGRSCDTAQVFEELIPARADGIMGERTNTIQSPCWRNFHQHVYTLFVRKSRDVHHALAVPGRHNGVSLFGRCLGPHHPC